MFVGTDRESDNVTDAGSSGSVSLEQLDTVQESETIKQGKSKQLITLMTVLQKTKSNTCARVKPQLVS